MILGITAIEAVILSAVLFLLLIGVIINDRPNGSSSTMWFATLLLAMMAGWMLVDRHTWSGFFNLLLTFDFWKPVLVYLGIGLVYSVIEFFVTAKSTEKKYRLEWQNTLQSKYRVHNRATGKDDKIPGFTLIELFKDGKFPYGSEYDTGSLLNFEALVKDTKRRVQSAYEKSIIELEVNEADMTVTPKINTLHLKETITVWTLFWPFYALARFVGDLLIKIFRLPAEMMKLLFKKIVGLMFSTTFKV